MCFAAYRNLNHIAQARIVWAGGKLQVWLDMERTLEAVLTGDKSMMLYGGLEAKETKSYEHGLEVLDALFDIEPNEPMAHVKPINEHFDWPKNW